MIQFQIHLEEPPLLLPELFDTYAAADWAVPAGVKFSIKKVFDDKAWRQREQSRFDSGFHTKLPWHDELPPRDLYAHVAKRGSIQVAFTENGEKGVQDLQTVQLPGRFLTKYYSDVLTPTEIEVWAAKLQATDTELKVTQDADEIESVYFHGPRSCMSGSDDDDEEREWGGPCHPARVYAGPDLAVAYIGPRSGAQARCVVWPDKKVYSSRYGAHARLKALLEARGYSPGSLSGARIQLIRCRSDRSVVMPYVDDISAARVEGDYIVLGGGPIETDNTDGTANFYPETATITCDGCCGEVDEDEASRMHDDNLWCDHCTELHAQRSSVDGELYPSWDLVYVLDRGWATPIQASALGAVKHEDEDNNDWVIPYPDPAPAPGQFKLVYQRDRPCVVKSLPGFGNYAYTGTFEEAQAAQRELSASYPEETYTILPVSA